MASSTTCCAMLRHPTVHWWLLLPVLAGLSAAWLWCGGIGIMPARSVMLLLVLVVGWGAWRGGAVPAGWSGAWLAAALVWQALTLNWSPLPETGALILAERLLALATALALFWRLGAEAAPVAVIAGATMLALDGLTDICGLESWISHDPPFGNPNFNAAAVPLIVLGWARWTVAGRSERLATLVGTSGAAAILLVHGTRSVPLVLVAGLGALAILRWLPRRLHLPALLGGLGLLAACQWWISVHGWPGLPFSWEQRRHLWSGAVGAWIEAPVLGHGLASSNTFLTAGPAADRAWLSVPSWPEHAHHEVLQTLIEGGLLQLSLLGAALLAILAPWWRARDQVPARALLAAWAALIVHALVESHLSQIGPLACLALLAAASWQQRESPPATAGSIAWRCALAAAAAVGAWMVVLDFRGGGSPPMLDRRARVALEVAVDQQDWNRALDIVAGLRRRVGPTGDLPLMAGRLQAKLKNYPAATEQALEQSRRLPVVPLTLDLLRRLANRHRQRGEHAEADALCAAWSEAARRVQSALEAVPANAKNQAVRNDLLKELAESPRTAADPPPPPRARP